VHAGLCNGFVSGGGEGGGGGGEGARHVRVRGGDDVECVRERKWRCVEVCMVTFEGARKPGEGLLHGAPWIDAGTNLTTAHTRSCPRADLEAQCAGVCTNIGAPISMEDVCVQRVCVCACACVRVRVCVCACACALRAGLRVFVREPGSATRQQDSTV